MTPASTYRLQLHAGFGFAAAAEISDYLDDLGVDAVYTSPYLQAQRGSTHGYDVVDHARIGSELGGAAAHAAWIAGLRARGIGHVLDLVPNHMGIGSGENAWWNDLLEAGPASPYDRHFDVTWDPPKAGMRGKLLLPVLGRQFGEALEAGELAVVRDGGAFFVAYYERRFPLAIKSLPTILEPALARAGLPDDDLGLAELHSLLAAIAHLHPESDTPPDAREARAREKDVIKRRLARLLADEPALAAAVDATLAELAGRVGDPRSFDALEALLQAQVYRLSSWRVATEEINYRRFFDVNDLAAVKMEDPAVFAAAHALVLDLVAAGDVTGLRLDHTDGLYDPAAYFAALQAELRARRPDDPPWLVIEKILAPGERLPAGWDVDGTTGYDFLGVVNGLWLAPEGGPRLTDFYRRFVAAPRGWPAVARDGRRTVLRSALTSEIHMLAHRLERIAGADRRSRDFTLASLTAAIVACIAAFPVYRTYVRPDGSHSPDDAARVAHALRRARRASDVDASVLEFLENALLLRRLPDDPDARAARVDFAMRFAQITGPVNAKGVEDTAFYRYHRMSCLNEVGGDPGAFGTDVAAFHAHNCEQQRRFPRTMTTTSTHDTKRGEDLRARLAVLSEIPGTWRRAVSAWDRMARLRRTAIDGALAPSRGDTYLFYQTVVGAFPLERAGDELAGDFVERLVAYMAKATREAKQQTGWLRPDAAYDAAVEKFVRELLGHPPFVAQARAVAEAIASHGLVNGLAQLCLKLAAPGVPDIYQGSELLNYSLVDPDNRRPVDYALRRRLLAELEHAAPADLLASPHDGRLKLLVTRRGLGHRRAHRDFYLNADYEPLAGDRHLVAFRRRLGARELVCVVPRLTYTLTGGRRPWPLADAWAEQEQDLGDPAPRVDLLTGAVHSAARLRLAEVFAALPVALLWRADP